MSPGMGSIARKFAKFRALPTQDQRILAAALSLMPVFWLALQILGFRRFIYWVVGTPAPGKKPLALDRVVEIGDLVNQAGFNLFGPDCCLIRSLYLMWLLRRLGVACDLRIGTQLTQGKLMGHAWVEVEGAPVNDARDIAQQYAVFEGSFTQGLMQK